MGAYSHMACAAAYPDMEPVGFGTFARAFAAVEAGECDLGMIPIENTLGGRVADIHHLLPESSLYIIGEHYQPCLLYTSPSPRDRTRSRMPSSA